MQVSFFNGQKQVLSEDEPLAQEFTKIRALINMFFKEEDGFGIIKSIEYVTGVRIKFANNDVVHLRYSKNKTTQFRVYTAADTQQRADELEQIAVKPGGIYDQMRDQQHVFDRAMWLGEAPDVNGGIDLDQAMLNLKVEKANNGLKMSTVAIPGFEIDKGIKPVIVKIVSFDIQNSSYLKRSGFSAGGLNIAINDGEL